MGTKETTTSRTPLELWAGGDVRSRSIGPAAGDHYLGRVDGAGLYFFVAPNTGGKSQHLRLISKLQQNRLLRSDANITDGADAAFLELGASKVAFRRLPTGEIAEPTRTGIESLPRIEEIPAPIDTLITGGNLKGKEPRARARLEALLTYAPIASDEALVRALCRVLDERAFGPEPGAERRQLWADLAERARGEKARGKPPEPFRTGAEILAAMLAAPREGILDDHGRLVDILNALANTGEKVHAAQAGIVSEAGGRLKEAVSAAARRLEVADDADLVARLRDRLSLPEPGPEPLAAARVALGSLQAERRRQVAEQDRRAALRASHGERPDDGPAREALAAAVTEFAEAGGRVDLLKLEVAAAAEALKIARPRGKAAREKVMGLWTEWANATMDVTALFFGGAPGDRGDLVIPVPSGLDSALASVDRCQAALAEGVRRAVSEFSSEARASEALVAAKNRLALAEEALAGARAAALAREAESDAISASIAAWESTAALLAQEVDGPDDAALEVADRAVAEAEADAELWRAALDFQRASAAHDREAERASWFRDVAADLRQAAADSWKFLGQIVTEQLSLPWLMVADMRMLLLYDGKGSNAHLARTPEDAKDVRDLDDPDRISTAELHEAMLKLMLSRREKLGGILVVPWQIMAALDEDRLRVFSGWSRDAGLVVFSERPRRAGDPKDLVLEFVQPTEEGGAT